MLSQPKTTAHFCLTVEGNGTDMFFDLMGFFIWKMEGRPKLFEKFSHILSEVFSSQTVSLEGVRQGIAIEYWTACVTPCPESRRPVVFPEDKRDWLDCEIEIRRIEFLEDHFCSFLSAGFRVSRNYVQNRYIQWGGPDILKAMLWTRSRRNDAELLWT